MSFFMKKGKAYGLIMPAGKKAAAAKPVSRPSAFGDSSSEEEDDGKRHVNTALKREQEKRKKQMDETASQALAEDPSIFEYDSVYDQMVEEKKNKNPKLSGGSNKPKYIHALKRAAERRKLEGELVYEHQAQREIERDAEQFKDKESYVTSGYKKKLAERRQLEEELAREAAMEAKNDVTKQKDLSRFHRHLFNQVASGGASERESKEPQPSESTKERDGNSGNREWRESYSSEKAGGERRHSSSGGSRERERQRGDSERQRDRERERRYSDRERHHKERRPSHRDRTESRGQDNSPEHAKPENTSTVDESTDKDRDAKKMAEKEGELSPPRKKTKIRAGIEVEEDEVTPVERRKLAAAKKATEDTTVSARERYLARKRAKADTRKTSTS